MTAASTLRKFTKPGVNTMIRQVLYSLGRLYFPWGMENVGYPIVRGMRICDPLSGDWECVEVVLGGLHQLDSAVFRYIPASAPSESVYRGEGPTGQVTARGKIRFNDPELPGIVYGLAPEPLRYDCGPETPPVNAATHEVEFLRADFVLRQIKTHIKWCRNHEERIALQHLKDALGL